ncbi:hypothetical protein ACJX0J_028004, partial [Zea mays]
MLTVAASPLQYVYIILFAISIKHLNRVFVSRGWNLKRKIRFALHTLFSCWQFVASINRLIYQAHLFWLELGGDRGGVQDNTATLDDNYIFSMSSFSRVLFSNFL